MENETYRLAKNGAMINAGLELISSACETTTEELKKFIACEYASDRLYGYIRDRAEAETEMNGAEDLNELIRLIRV